MPSINIKIGDIEDFKGDQDTYFAVVPAAIKSKQDLLKSYAEVLKFPEYFGFNWDALDESLSDFNWIKDKKI